MLNEKVIVVTGGAGLLGREFSSAIAKQGGHAIVADLDVETSGEVVDSIKQAGGLAESAIIDITDSESVDHLIALLHAKYGHIDSVVNNSYPRNKNWGNKLEEVTYADFCENISLHIGGYFLIAQKFALYFRRYGGGNIINMASIYGVMAPRFDVYANTSMTMPIEYSAIKAAIVQLTRYFAQYFKSDGIRCNALSPGGILDQQPQEFLRNYDSYCGGKGMLEAQDIIGALLFLLSDASKYVTGQNLIVDDGFSL